jgi:hypothetical protein
MPIQGVYNATAGCFQAMNCPKATDLIYLYAASYPVGIWKKWNWQTSDATNDGYVSTASTTWGEGALLQAMNQNIRWDWNAGGSDDRNGNVDTGIAFGGTAYYIGLSTDTNGTYLNGMLGVGVNRTSQGDGDGIPGMVLGPANSGEQAMNGYPDSYAMSMGWWFRYRKADNGDSNAREGFASIDSTPASGKVNCGIYMQDSSMKMLWTRRNSSGTFSTANTFSYTFSVNTLYCVLFTMSTSGSIKMYVNGSLEDSFSETNTIDTIGTTIGSYYFGSSTPADTSYASGGWCGDWYKSAVWKTELNSTDAVEFYNLGPGVKKYA